MIRRYLFWVVLCLSLGLSSCATFRPAVPRLEPEKACAEWRWIGISRDGTRCPEVPGWTVRPMFPQVPPVSCSDPKAEVNEVVRELNRFCTYEITSPIKGLSHLPFPPAVSNDLERFDQDCAALSVSARTEPAGEDWQDQFKKLLVQAGKPDAPLNINDHLGVRLAFLDTQPTGKGWPEKYWNSPHGYTLAQIARQLVCTSKPDENCAAQITTRLAMPIIDFDSKRSKHNEVDEERGGYLGMQSDLAKAIQSEVDDWLSEKQRLPANKQEHLVLNLSMAWDGDLFGGLDQRQIEEMRAGSQAVYRALQYASKFDVLVLAAAGNQKRSPCENAGPLLPGGWEGMENQSCGKPKATKPLVYAVGGIGADGEALSNARHGGMPLRAAYGENAVVPPWSPKQLPVLLTGSSVSTAIVSSIAAIVWDTRPDLDSKGVMDLLYGSGDALSSNADFWSGAHGVLPSPLYKVHRISLCAALEAACLGDPNHSGSCPVAACMPWKPEASAVTYFEPKLESCQPWLYPQPEDDPRLRVTPPPPPPSASR